MKIFYNWLHRRLNANMEYCRVPHHKGDIYVDDGISADRGVKKAGTDKEALLLDPNVASIQHVLEGILTIGTLGHLDGHCEGPIGAAAGVPQEFPSGTTSAFQGAAEEEEEERGVPVELAPSAEHLMTYRRSAIESFRKEMAPVEEDVKNSVGQVAVSIADEEEVLLEPLLGEIIQVDKRERVTLADLLAAEELHSEKADATSQAASASAKAAMEMAVNGAAKMTMVGVPLPCSSKHSQVLNKKLVPWKKGKEEYSTPATGKLHQRLRRMLKKKIHPEMARDVQARGAEQGSHDHSVDQPVSLI